MSCETQNKTDVETINIPVDAGDCFTRLMEFFEEDEVTPKDVSTWVFTGQIRELYDSPAVLAEFEFSQVGYENYQVLVSLTAEQTAALPIAEATNPGKKNIKTLSYDWKAEIDGCEYTIQQGAVYVSPSVTKPVV
jgi:hypothetical protein